MSIWNILSDRKRGYAVKADPPATDALWFRSVLRKDLAEIVEIEGKSFEHPWDEEGFKQRLAYRNMAGLVAEQKDRVVGYIVYEFYRGHFYIANLAVSPESRRQRVGSDLVREVTKKLGAYRDQVTACVSEANLPAQLFLKSRRFICTGIVESHFDGGFDAYHFRYTAPTKDGLTGDARRQGIK
jgi:ribosomal-protein-alanine N-acetyltransferase